MNKILILALSLIIDFLIPNITLYSFNNITYFFPMATVISLIFIDDYKLILISSIIYGALYTGNIVLSITLFFLISIFCYIYRKYFMKNLITIILQILIVIFLYDFLYFLIYSFVYNQFIWNNLFYKVSHSLITNIIYGTTLYRLTLKRSSKLNY